MFKKEDASKGKFAFTTEEYEMYKICFESEGKRYDDNIANVDFSIVPIPLIASS